MAQCINYVIIRKFTIDGVEHLITQHKTTRHVKLLKQDINGGFSTIATTQKSIISFLKNKYKMGCKFIELEIKGGKI